MSWSNPTRSVPIRRRLPNDRLSRCTFTAELEQPSPRLIRRAAGRALAPAANSLALSLSRSWRRLAPPLGSSPAFGAPGRLGGALSALHHHRARRDDRDHRRDHVRSRADDGEGDCLWARLPRHGGALVALLQPRMRRSQSADSRSPTTALCSPVAPTRSCTWGSSPASSLSVVGDELVIAHPSDELTNAELAAVVCGPVVLPAGPRAAAAADDWHDRGQAAGGRARLSRDRPIGTFAPALVVAAFLLFVLVALIVGDHVAAARRKGRGGTLSARAPQGDEVVVIVSSSGDALGTGPDGVFRRSSGPRSADAGFAVRRPASLASLADLADAT